MIFNNLVILSILFNLLIFPPAKTENNIDKHLNNLLEKRDFFELEEFLLTNQDKISEDRLLFYQAFLAKAFGDMAESSEKVNVLLKNHAKEFNDTVIVKLLDLQAENYIYTYQYRKASEIYEKILKDFPTILDSTNIQSYENVKNLFGAFADIKPQKINKVFTDTISSYKNQFQHLMIPVKCNEISEDFIFDTGANFSTITTSQAFKMNLRLIDQNVNIGSSTQVKVQSKLAIADSLYVGNILFENVIFLVMSDEQLSFPEINYHIRGIIGFPVIYQMEEIHLHENGKIIVPVAASKKNTKNMFLDGLNPVIQTKSGNNTLLFTFDTGASNSDLSFKYYQENRDFVEKNGKLQSNLRGGAGGRTAVEEYYMSNFSLRIGQMNFHLTEIPVNLEEYTFNKYFDGNLGQDVISQYNIMKINFRDMYIDFE